MVVKRLGKSGCKVDTTLEEAKEQESYPSNIAFYVNECSKRENMSAQECWTLRNELLTIHICEDPLSKILLLVAIETLPSWHQRHSPPL